MKKGSLIVWQPCTHLSCGTDRQQGKEEMNHGYNFTVTAWEQASPSSAMQTVMPTPKQDV